MKVKTESSPRKLKVWIENLFDVLAVGVLRTQRLTIKSLSDEHRRLSRELSLYKAVPHDVDRRLEIGREQSALEDIRLLTEDLSKAESISGTLSQSLSLLQNRLKRPSSGTASVPCGVDQRNEALEKRLHNLIVKFNEIVSNNAALREEVDNHKQEKVEFGKLETKLLEQISDSKRKSSKLIDEINCHYAAKDKAMSELHHLRTVADSEHFDFDKQLKALNKLIESDLHLHRPKDFCQPPAQIRVDEEIVKDANEDGASTLRDRQHVVDSLRKRLGEYESLFCRIKEATGFVNIDELITAFSSLESSNYSLYTRIEFLVSEYEKLKVLRDHECKSLTNECGHAIGYVPNDSSDDNQVLERILEKTRITEDTVARMGAKTDKITDHIHSMFSVLRKEQQELIESARTTVTDILEANDDSVLLYLSRIDSMLEMYRGLIKIDKSNMQKNTTRHYSMVNLLALPSSIRVDDEETKLSSDKILPHEELVKLAASVKSTANKHRAHSVASMTSAANKQRAPSAASTRPSTNHKVDRKSLTNTVN